MNELDMDVRLLRRNIAKGFMSRAEVDKMLVTLPDIESQGVWIDVDNLGQQDAPAEVPAGE